MTNPETAAGLYRRCLENRLFVNLTQETIIRLFPALNITLPEADEGLALFADALA